MSLSSCDRVVRLNFSRGLTSFIALLIVGLTAALIGCAGAERATSEGASSSEGSDEAAASKPAGPDLQYLTYDSEGIRYEDLRHDESDRLLTADRPLGVSVLSPGDRSLAVAYAAGDSSKLATIDLETLDVRRIHSVPGPAVYSVSWAPDGGQLGFGYYRPRGDDEMGAGGISIAQLDGTTRSVGCRAAKEILKWLPDGNLAVRDEENLYVVAADGCGTISSLDIRKMHHITYSPTGRRMAYIFRDLVYDRENAEYVPDSTLYVSDARGGSENEIFGDAYRARNLRWSPDGSQLAFDVRSRDDRSRRQIILYDVERDRLTYLIPPEMAGSRDEVQPRWSPSGDNLVFTLVGESGRHAAIHRMGQTQILGSVDDEVWGWVGNERIAFSDADTTRIVDIEGETAHAFPNDRELLHIWPSSETSIGTADRDRNESQTD